MRSDPCDFKTGIIFEGISADVKNMAIFFDQEEGIPLCSNEKWIQIVALSAQPAFHRAIHRTPKIKDGSVWQFHGTLHSLDSPPKWYEAGWYKRDGVYFDK